MLKRGIVEKILELKKVGMLKIRGAIVGIILIKSDNFSSDIGGRMRSVEKG